MHWPFLHAGVDPSLDVHRESPEGGRAVRPDWWDFTVGDDRTPYHQCRWCGGWVAGPPAERREDSLGPLCGRRGTSFHCRRCGMETGFTGMMS